ncbi:MAG: alpha/beta hydrolase [Chloroflexi bacterium]|nr:alpha/beta hydrolase [Chloroflexota bacterium]
MQTRLQQLADLTLVDGEMTFAFTNEIGPVQAVLAPDGAALSGTVTQGETASPFHLLRLGEASTEPLSGYTGLYAAAPDHLIGLYIGNEQFWVRDYQTGRMGILRPLADGSFLLGAGLQLYYPFVATIRFTVDNDGQINSLTWTPGDGSAPMTATRLPDTYSEEEVTFTNGDVTLAGTLLIPEGPGPHPAAVMIHGSDPARRTSGFYRAWADWLVHQGLAVLLYDKRGVGDSTGHYAEFASDTNLDNLAGDALAGVQMLKTRPEIDPARIGIQGPSQAGWVGPRAAAQSPDVAFMVMLVGPTVSPSQESLQEQLEIQRLLGANNLTDEEITAQILAAGSSSFDPVDYLEPLTIPVLWLYGGRDRSIPTYASMAVLEQLDKPNFTIELFPTGNHGLFDAQTGWDDEFPYLPGAVPGLFTTIETWLAEVVFN